MKVLEITKKNFNKVLKTAIESIKGGEVIVCPTDTIYGLIGDATNKKAVDKVFRIKKRPKTKPIPIFVKDLKMAKRLAKIGEEEEKYLKKVWPGKVTAVLKKKRGKGTIGLRIPNHQWLLNLVKQLNCPLTGTSANISGKPPSGNIKEVLKQFKGQKHQPDLVVEAGVLFGKPSTVIDLTTFPYKILRP